jgi:aryl-alcohol dehydrogenase-like predicted oxidoreductase
MDRIRLGELEVSRQGLGCMGMSEWYGAGDWDTSIATIHRAIELGVTFIDTADVYGAGHNEVLVGRALHDRRDQVQLATKFGIDRSGGDDARKIRGEAGYVKRSCESSLLRLGVDTIDLYYLHRPPQTAEIEETVGAMAELVAEGKVRYLGLSEVDESLLRRAYAVHPITAVQSEYSLWTRDAEALTPAMAELGVGLVPYSPLGRGFLTGTLDLTKLDDKDFRGANPRFKGEAGEANQAIVRAVQQVAERRGVTASQGGAGLGVRTGRPAGSSAGTDPRHQADQVAGAERRGAGRTAHRRGPVRVEPARRAGRRRPLLGASVRSGIPTRGRWGATKVPPECASWPRTPTATATPSSFINRSARGPAQARSPTSASQPAYEREPGSSRNGWSPGSPW